MQGPEAISFGHVLGTWSLAGPLVVLRSGVRPLPLSVGVRVEEPGDFRSRFDEARGARATAGLPADACPPPSSVGCWKPDREGRSLPDAGAGDAHAAVTVGGRVGAVEPVEHVTYVLGLDALAGVDDRELHPLAYPAAGERDGAAGGCRSALSSRLPST